MGHRNEEPRGEAPKPGDALLRDATRLTRLLAALNEPAPTEAYLDRILSTISELFLVDVAILIDPDGTGDFKPVASLGLPESAAVEAFDGLRAAQFNAHRSVATVADLGDRGLEPEMAEAMRRLGVSSGAWIPVAGSREPRGALLLARCKPPPFTREETDLLSTMAYRIGLALEQMSQRTQLELLARGMRELVRSPDGSHIADQAVRFLRRIARADEAALLGETAEGRLAWEAATSGLVGRGEIPSGARGFFDGEPASGEARATTEDAVVAAVAESLGCPCASLLAVPVPVAAGRRKWLAALRRRPIPFGEGTKRIAPLLSSQVGSFLDDAALYLDLQRELAERTRAEAALRESEAVLRASRDELQKMVETRDRLFSIIGHDLRGPVGSMCSLLRLVTEETRGRSPGDRDYVLSEVLQAGESINQLLGNLMEWGKAQQAEIKLRPRRVVLRLCVEEVLALLGAQAAAKGVELDDEVEPQASLVADPDGLQAILRNLVSNAVKFSRPGGKVVVSAAEEEGRIRVLVADSGVGMAEEELKAVLDFSSRHSTSGTAGEKGTGLGLILCRDLAEKNGGSLRIESEVRKGTVVTLEFGARG